MAPVSPVGATSHFPHTHTSRLDNLVGPPHDASDNVRADVARPHCLSVYIPSSSYAKIKDVASSGPCPTGGINLAYVATLAWHPIDPATWDALETSNNFALQSACTFWGKWHADAVDGGSIPIPGSDEVDLL